MVSESDRLAARVTARKSRAERVSWAFFRGEVWAHVSIWVYPSCMSFLQRRWLGSLRNSDLLLLFCAVGLGSMRRTGMTGV
jgi:hypothetical protein